MKKESGEWLLGLSIIELRKPRERKFIPQMLDRFLEGKRIGKQQEAYICSLAWKYRHHLSAEIAPSEKPSGTYDEFVIKRREHSNGYEIPKDAPSIEISPGVFMLVSDKPTPKPDELMGLS